MRKEYDLENLKVKRRGLPRALRGKRVEHAKVRVTIALDSDVIEYFKKAAAVRGALPYQTQINRTLRAAIKQAPADALKSELLKDKVFLRTLAREMAQA